MEEYDFGVVRPIKDLPVINRPSTHLIAAGNLFDNPDVEGTICDAVKAKYPYLEAVSLTHQAITAGNSWMIEQLIETIRTARFATYRVNELCLPTTFLSLGISIALNRPYLMIQECGSEIPADLRGIRLFQFSNFSTLEERFVAKHRAFFDKHAR